MSKYISMALKPHSKFMALVIMLSLAVTTWAAHPAQVASQLHARNNFALRGASAQLNTPATVSNDSISGRVTDANGNGLSGVEISFVGDQHPEAVIVPTDANGNFAYNYETDTAYTVTASKRGYTFSPSSVREVSSRNLSGNFTANFTATQDTTSPGTGFSIPAYVPAPEFIGKAVIYITRTGDTSGPASLGYHTVDETASQKSDYTMMSGTLRFAPGETVKAIEIPIIDDEYFEGNETFKVVYDSGLSGFGPTTQVFIEYNDFPGQTNPIEDSKFFVRQHYYDFLSRFPDQGGQTYWSAQINACTNETDPQRQADCFRTQRINVSAAFFIELEFQETGSYIYRLYKASYGRIPTYAEFMPDRSRVVGGTGLEASKQSFVYQWSQRAEFKQAYPDTMSNTDFVNKLYDTAGLTTDANERNNVVLSLNNGRTRAQVLRDAIETQSFKDREYNQAFVLMQYFGYLRRDPDAGGYQFWLDVLNRLPPPNNYRSMVCAFLTSAEYQDRFSPVRVRNNNECGQ